MGKRYLSTGGLIGAGLLSYFFLKNLTEKNAAREQKEMTTLEKAGRPDQMPIEDIADLENAKMVSEGSQYGVNYYNEQKNDGNIH